MKFSLRSIIASAALATTSFAFANNTYGLPEKIEDGNILHCFDWKFNDIKNELPKIAEAGFVAVQVSPVERNIPSGYIWYDLYRPYDFKFSTSGLGNETQFKALIEEAEKYGIKIIVDVVFNHVDKSPNHANWWNEGDRLRTNTANVNYGNRNSITHDRLGDYPDVNTENADVIARAKEYVEELKELGVSGIRFDAAKHIGLPSEGSNFWKEVTSVPGMFYYGEILGTPGGSNANELMKEYTEYMYVTDDTYSKTARNSMGAPSSEGNWSTKGIDPSKLVYWGESHDTYANETNYGGETKNVSQATIDKAYAILSCRNNGIGLYLSRPSSNVTVNIKVGQKGSTHFIDPEIAEVNKFKNLMVGKKDEYVQSGSTACVIRENGGAVIVTKTKNSNISIENKNGYCPIGTYYDRVSGNEFTVTKETISGKTGETGIAVIYPENFDAGVGDIIEDTATGTVSWYTFQGIRVNEPSTPGIYIKKYSGGKTQKVIVR